MLGTRVRVRRRRQRRLAAACGLVLVMFAGSFWFFAERRSAPTVETPASAIADIPKRQTLPDGSIVELKDDSRISVVFTPIIRRVALLSGEAHFQVAKNKDRPFAVIVGNVEVRAVGTAFLVQKSDSNVEVLVTEGQVTLSKVLMGSSDSGGPAPQQVAIPQTITTLDAGNRAIIKITKATDSPPMLTVQAMSASEIDQRLSWRIPRLEFTQTPLSKVIKMINELGQERLSIADKSLEDVRISGILRADHIETLLRLLEAEDGIKAERRPDGEIVLTRNR